MSNKARNIFFVIGIVAIVVMLLTFDVSFSMVLENLSMAGYWFLLVMLLWAFLYAMNTCTWLLLLKSSGEFTMPFWKLYKITVTSFALNSATPCGLMGSEPYKIMELKSWVGVNRATSSVLLFAMMHVFSHFWFWLTAVVLFAVLESYDASFAVLLAVVGAFCLLVIYFFIKGYKVGISYKAIKFLTHVPFVKNWARRFIEEKAENLRQIDAQIAQLHSQSRGTFAATLALEYFGRIIGCSEVFFILQIFNSDISYVQCIYIMAFTSLFANMLFFIPMQVGGREGGFALSAKGLAIPAGYGFFVGLICRVRELIWTVIGMSLMKVGNRTK